MAVAVMMGVSADRLQLWRSAATMSGLAANGFKLNGRMVNVKTFAQRRVDAFKNAAALRHRHLGDRNVTRQCV